jgi:four helix bundle protein
LSGEVQADGLKTRTKTFALDVLELFRSLPRNMEARVIGTQLLRSSTSVAANYRAACRARSKSEFIAKMGVVVEEADESLFWLELLLEGGVIRNEATVSLLKEANQLVAIFVASRRTAVRKTLKS